MRLRMAPPLRTSNRLASEAFLRNIVLPMPGTALLGIPGTIDFIMLFLPLSWTRRRRCTWPNTVRHRSRSRSRSRTLPSTGWRGVLDICRLPCCSRKRKISLLERPSIYLQGIPFRRTLRFTHLMDYGLYTMVRTPYRWYNNTRFFAHGRS